MEKDNTLLFFEFLRANGFSPNNYEGILELLQSAKDSLSKYLIYFNHYLLSEKVRCDELYTYGINGGNGYIDKNGITLIEKPYINLKQNHECPSIDKFGSIICYHEDFDMEIKRICIMFYIPKDKFFGFITDKNDETLKTKLSIYKNLLECVNGIENKEYELIHDSITSYDKEFYLVKRKGIR